MIFFKQLEQVNKAFWYHTVFRWWFRNAPARLPLNLMHVRRLLIMRRDMIGDMVITTSLIRTLYEKNPDLEIDVFASPQNKIIVQHNPRVQRVFASPVPSRELLGDLPALKARDYDAVLCLSYTGATKDGLIANFISPRAVKAAVYETRNADLYKSLFNAQIDIGRADGEPREPLYLALHRFASQLFGFELKPQEIKQELYFSGADEENAKAFIAAMHLNRFIVFNISARKAFRMWGVENCCRFLLQVSEAYPDLQFVITSAPAEREAAEELFRRVAKRNVIIVPPEFSLLTLACLISQASAAISPDTAVVHIAATYHIPMVILCTPLSSSIEWEPLHAPHINVATDGEEAVSTIAPHRVAAAFDQLYAAHLAPAASTHSL
ncbi:MAG: glycosyltransferase family 9 protein [Rhizobacter sp.]|nr:glycosyltransferase family 9 protein [Chlorobiales bacterium]